MRVDSYAEHEVGWPAGFERRHDAWALRCPKNELDLLAARLFEGGDDLPDRRVLLGRKSLLPPDHEVGGLGAERRDDDR